MKFSSISRNIGSFVAALLLVTMSACRTSKPSYSGDINAVDASSATTSRLFTELADSYYPWTTLYVPVTLSLESPKQLSISGRATMVYGEAIHISLRMIGMEIGVLYIDRNSIYVIDKYHKYYFKENIADLLKGMDISIVDLQDLLLGRAVIPGKGVIKADDSDDFSFLSSDSQWILTPQKQFKGAEWHYLASKTDPPLLSAVSLRLADGSVVECRFTEATTTPAGIVDGISTITLPFKKGDVGLSLIWNLSDAQWNTDRNIKFSEPSASYRRLSMEEIISAISI